MEDLLEFALHGGDDDDDAFVRSLTLRSSRRAERQCQDVVHSPRH